MSASDSSEDCTSQGCSPGAELFFVSGTGSMTVTSSEEPIILFSGCFPEKPCQVFHSSLWSSLMLRLRDSNPRAAPSRSRGKLGAPGHLRQRGRSLGPGAEIWQVDPGHGPFFCCGSKNHNQHGTLVSANLNPCCLILSHTHFGGREGLSRCPLSLLS